MAKKRRTKQTARKITCVNVPAHLRTGPPSYNDRIKAGGPRGERTPDERALIIKNYVLHLYAGRPLPLPSWFAERFPVYPAYKFTPWEISFVNLEPGFITKAKFLKYWRTIVWLNREQETAEIAAYNSVELALSTIPVAVFKDTLTLSVRCEADWETESDSD
eukprot:jgi/Botrbrau1/2924/Bobra.0026s0001.1